MGDSSTRHYNSSRLKQKGELGSIDKGSSIMESPPTSTDSCCSLVMESLDLSIAGEVVHGGSDGCWCEYCWV